MQTKKMLSLLQGIFFDVITKAEMPEFVLDYLDVLQYILSKKEGALVDLFHTNAPSQIYDLQYNFFPFSQLTQTAEENKTFIDSWVEFEENCRKQFMGKIAPVAVFLAGTPTGSLLRGMARFIINDKASYGDLGTEMLKSKDVAQSFPWIAAFDQKHQQIFNELMATCLQQTVNSTRVQRLKLLKCANVVELFRAPENAETIKMAQYAVKHAAQAEAPEEISKAAYEQVLVAAREKLTDNNFEQLKPFYFFAGVEFNESPENAARVITWLGGSCFARTFNLLVQCAAGTIEQQDTIDQALELSNYTPPALVTDVTAQGTQVDDMTFANNHPWIKELVAFNANITGLEMAVLHISYGATQTLGSTVMGQLKNKLRELCGGPAPIQGVSKIVLEMVVVEDFVEKFHTKAAA